MYTLSPKARFSSSVGNGLFNSASLDLHFAKTKSLVDATTGSNLVDFTRASSGTYVGSDGLIKTATTNLVTYSQDFDQWSATNATVTPNAELAPDGTTTADQVTSTASDPWVQRSVTTASAGAYTFSVYIKAATGVSSNVVALRVFDSDGTIYGSTSISVTTEWQRYQISVTTAKPVTIVRVDAPNFATIGDVFYLWGAQLEQSSTVGEYIPTTSTINSAPRFDHDPTTGESLGLLVEESRTNLYVYSEDASQWAYTNGSYYLDSAAIAPDGSAGAYVVYPTSNIPRINPGNISLVSGTRYTFSVFCKAKEFSTVGCFWNTTSIDPDVYGSTTFVNLNTGVSSDPSIVQTVGYPNGWWRLIINGALADANATAHVTIVPGSTGNPNTIVPNGTDGIYAWGAQMEASASFPTSYIPTSGSGVITPGYTSPAVTRAADVASISGSNFSSWYRQDEGTVFSDWSTPSSIELFPWIISDGTLNNSIRVSSSVAAIGSNTRLVVLDGNSLQAGLAVGVYTPSSRRKTAFAYKLNNFAGVADGGSIATDTSGTIPTVDRLFIGSNWSGSDGFLCGHIRRLTHWPTRLGNEALQTITQ